MSSLLPADPSEGRSEHCGQRPSPIPEALQERREAHLSFRIVRGEVHQHTDPAPRSACCARAASGNAAAAPPSSVMNSRRPMKAVI